jgi:uncharacterized protein YecE (DUF72 family)
MGKILIGTSGFSYPHWGKGIFYPQNLPQSQWFDYYCQHFNSLELNVSFYRLPQKETFKGWRRRAGQDFVFAVKGSRYITQMKKLKECQEPVKRFFKNAEAIKDNREVVLWQLPPRFKVNPERLTEFLKNLPKKWRYAFEFREKSWFAEEIYEISRKNKIALVFQDHPGWPICEKVTADFVYLRFHGRTQLYSSCYTKKELNQWAKKIRDWQSQDLDIYAYFNNDALGYAIENAQTLKKLCLKER